jgi:hypothetical protein
MFGKSIVSNLMIAVTRWSYDERDAAKRKAKKITEESVSHSINQILAKKIKIEVDPQRFVFLDRNIELESGVFSMGEDEMRLNQEQIRILLSKTLSHEPFGLIDI